MKNNRASKHTVITNTSVVKAMPQQAQHTAKALAAIVMALVLAFTLGIGLTTNVQEAYAASKPAKVKNVKVASVNYNTVKVSWSKASGAKKYVVYRATSKNGTYKKVKTTTSTSWKDTKKTCGKTYYYKVRAYNGKYGSYSSKVSGKAKPAKVSGLSLSGSDNAVTVKWTKQTGASGYQIYRATSKSGTYTRVKTITSASTTSWKNSSLTAGKTYYYKIRSYRTVSGSKVYGSFTSVKSKAVSGYVDVSSAYTLLNEFRTTSGVWYWNSDDSTKTYFNQSGYTTLSALETNSSLESTAKVRAKELATLYSHTRPDGTTCFTAFPSGYTAAGENIAAGYSSCSSVITAWEEEDDDYSGQGHRRNMLSTYYDSVGIACYVSVGSTYTYYWAMDLATL